MTKRNRAKMTITVPAELYLWAGTEANLRETSLSAIVTEALVLSSTGCLFKADTKELLKLTREAV